MHSYKDIIIKSLDDRLNASAPGIMNAAIGCLTPSRIRLRGVLGERVRAAVPYLVALYDGTHPNARVNIDMLEPFVDRKVRIERPWDGEYAGKWLDAASSISAATGSAELGRRADALAGVLRFTQKEDGYTGISGRTGEWDLWTQMYTYYGLMSHVANRHSLDSLAVVLRHARYLVERYLHADRLGDLLAGAWSGGASAIALGQVMELYRITQDEEIARLGDYMVSQFRPFGAMRSIGRSILTQAYLMLGCLGAMVVYHQNRPGAEELEWVGPVWQDLVDRHTFHTGSLGQGELLRTQDDYALTTRKQETCATMEWLLFTERMYLATGDVRYMHQIEATLYNALLGAQSQDGMRWMYHTPMNGEGNNWFEGPTRCCYWSGPLAISRILGYIYHTDSDGIRIDLYENSHAQEISVSGGVVSLRMETDYPASGAVKIVLLPKQPLTFAVKLRIPPWADGAVLSVNGDEWDNSPAPGEYAVIERQWHARDHIDLELGMPAFMTTRPGMPNIKGGAIQRGPEVLSVNAQYNKGIDLDKVEYLSAPEVAPRGSKGRERIYACKCLLDGRPTQIYCTPFSQAGDGAPYRTVLPIANSAS